MNFIFFILNLALLISNLAGLTFLIRFYSEIQRGQNQLDPQREKSGNGSHCR